MDAPLQRRIQRYGWDKAALYYEAFWQKQLRPAQQLVLEMAEIKEGDCIIDVACGTGLVSFPAAQAAGETGYVLATDISDNMVNHAKVLATEKGIINISFKRMDAETLEADDNSFDIAICALGLMYVPDPLKALQEMLRVLKPGGKAVAAVWGERKNCGWAEIFEIVDRRVASEVCPMFFQLGNPEVLLKSFNHAGFSSVRAERISSVLEYTSREEACGAAFAGGPVALAYHKFNHETREEAHAEYLASIKFFKSGTGYHIPGEFVVASGVKAGS